MSIISCGSLALYGDPEINLRERGRGIMTTH